MKIRTLLVSSVAGLVLLAGCGQDFCVLGLGPCTAPRQPHSDNPTTTDPLKFSSPPAYVYTSERVTFAVTGGNKPYRFSIATGAGLIHQTTGEFLAPTIAGPVGVRVTDAAGKTRDYAIMVEERPPG